MEVSDLILPLGILGGILLLVVTGVFVFWFIKRKKGGIDVAKIKKQLEVEEVEEPTEEPEMEDVEEIEEVEQPKPQPKPPQTPICKVIVAGGKSYQGRFLGEEPQLITLQNGNLVKVESYWIILQTEQLPYLRINRRFIILMAFTANPFNAQSPPQPKPKPEEVSLDSLEV